MSGERVRCPRCGRWFAARVPKGGDGSAVRLARHKRIADAGITYTVHCAGSDDLVER